MTETQELRTVMEILDELRADRPHLQRHHLKYAIDAGRIKPTRWIGATRVFDDAGVAQIRKALEETQSK